MLLEAPDGSLFVPGQCTIVEQEKNTDVNRQAIKVTICQIYAVNLIYEISWVYFSFAEIIQNFPIRQGHVRIRIMFKSLNF